MNIDPNRKEELLLELRADLKLKNENSNEIETFQNEVLRPILKFQHSLIVRSFEIELKKLKLHERFTTSNEQQKKVLLKGLLKGTFRGFMIGRTVGLMQFEEFNFYLKNSTDFDKRIVAMAVERFLSSETQ
jgi:hypothetical protein